MTTQSRSERGEKLMRPGMRRRELCGCNARPVRTCFKSFAGAWLGGNYHRMRLCAHSGTRGNGDWFIVLSPRMRRHNTGEYNCL